MLKYHPWCTLAASVQCTIGKIPTTYRFHRLYSSVPRTGRTENVRSAPRIVFGVGRTSIRFAAQNVNNNIVRCCDSRGILVMWSQIHNDAGLFSYCFKFGALCSQFEFHWWVTRITIFINNTNKTIKNQVVLMSAFYLYWKKKLTS